MVFHEAIHRALQLHLHLFSPPAGYIECKQIYTFSNVSNSALRDLSAQTFFWAIGLLVFAPVAFKPAPTCIYATGKLKTNVYSENHLNFQSISLLLA